jgi:hypothetical protein
MDQVREYETQLADVEALFCDTGRPVLSVSSPISLNYSLLQRNQSRASEITVNENYKSYQGIDRPSSRFYCCMEQSQ